MGLQLCCCQMSNNLTKKCLTKTGEFMADLVLLNLRPEAALLKKAQAQLELKVWPKHNNLECEFGHA